MDRKTYMKNIYSQYWINAREKIYGFPQYDKNLCNFVCKNIPRGKNILEVGIGTVSTGSSIVSSGVIANSNGFLVSSNSSGFEIGRIDESLGFIGK